MVVNQARRFQAHELLETSRPQPVEVWGSRLDLALFVIGMLAILFIVVVLAPGGAA